MEREKNTSSLAGLSAKKGGGKTKRDKGALQRWDRGEPDAASKSPGTKVAQKRQTGGVFTNRTMARIIKKNTLGPSSPRIQIAGPQTKTLG